MSGKTGRGRSGEPARKVGKSIPTIRTKARIRICALWTLTSVKSKDREPGHSWRPTATGVRDSACDTHTPEAPAWCGSHKSHSLCRGGGEGDGESTRGAGSHARAGRDVCLATQSLAGAN